MNQRQGRKVADSSDSLDEWTSSRSNQSASASMYDALQPYPEQTMQRRGTDSQNKALPSPQMAAGVKSRVPGPHDILKGAHRGRSDIAVASQAGHLNSHDVGISPISPTGFMPESPSLRGTPKSNASDSLGHSELGLVPAGLNSKKDRAGFEGDFVFGKDHAGKTNQSSIGKDDVSSYLDSKVVGIQARGRVRNAKAPIDHINLTKEVGISNKQDTGVTSPLPTNSPLSYLSPFDRSGGYDEELDDGEEDAGDLMFIAPNSPAIVSPNGGIAIAGRRQGSNPLSPSAMTDHFSNSHHGLSANIPDDKPRRAPAAHRADSIVQGDKVAAMVAAGNKLPEPGYPVPRNSSLGGAHNASHLGSNFVSLGEETHRSRPTAGLSNRSHLGSNPLESQEKAAGIKINSAMRHQGSLSVSDGLILQGEERPKRINTKESSSFQTTHDGTYGNF